MPKQQNRIRLLLSKEPYVENIGMSLYMICSQIGPSKRRADFLQGAYFQSEISPRESFWPERRLPLVNFTPLCVAFHVLPDVNGSQPLHTLITN